MTSALYMNIYITPGHTSDRVLHFWNSPPVIMGIYKGQTPKDITDQVFGPLKSTTGTVHDFTPYLFSPCSTVRASRVNNIRVFIRT